MSYDVFFQGFKRGDAAAGGGASARTMLAPHLTKSEPEHNFLRIEVDDGGADVYLSDDHMMVNHAGGQPHGTSWSERQEPRTGPSCCPMALPPSPICIRERSCRLNSPRRQWCSQPGPSCSMLSRVSDGRLPSMPNL